VNKDNGLSHRQLVAIRYLLSSSSLEEASQNAKVSRTTLYKWLKDDRFKAEVRRQRDEVIQSALNRLKSAITEAVEELIKLTKAQREEVRRLACNDIITHVLKSIEIEDIEQRLDKVERIVLERKTYR
jgi:AcrR family transcriptional regulator